MITIAKSGSGECEVNKRSTYLEIAYNGAGYRDQTAYEAIKNIRKEEKAVKEFYPGDIWTMQTATGSCEVLMLSVFENYSTILMLSEKRPKENAMEIMSKAVMYTDVGKISYGFHSRMLDFRKCLPEPDLKNVLRQVGDTLGMGAIYSGKPQETAKIEPTAAAEAKPSISSQEGKETQQAAANKPGTASASARVPVEAYNKLMMKCAQAEAERDVYKELFYKSNPQFNGAVVG